MDSEILWTIKQVCEGKYHAISAEALCTALNAFLGQTRKCVSSWQNGGAEVEVAKKEASQTLGLAVDRFLRDIQGI